MLRLHGGTEDDRLIPIPVGKLSIGSGPRCSVRLPYDGVRPLHCLVTRDERGLRVRRWADDILLNGAAFDEASLAPNDRLTIGSIELEVVGTAPDDDARTPPAAAQCPTAETDTALDAPQATASEIVGSTVELSPPSPVSPEVPASVPAAAAIADRSASGPPNVLTRTRRRKLLAALRFHHQMGIQLERAVTSLEEQMRDVSAEQANSTAEGGRLTDSLATLVAQVREYRGEQAALEQRHAEWLEQSRGWESQLEEHQQRLMGFEREAERSRAVGDNMHRRGRKLVANLRKGRESFRALDERLAGLEQKTQKSCAERDRLRDEITKALEQQGAQGHDSLRALDERLTSLEQKIQESSIERDRLHDELTQALEQQSVQESQSAAWNAVVEATDRLSNNYKQLVAENSRLTSEIEKFAAARGELAVEKAAASEMLAMLRDQFNENQQRQVEFDFQRGQWRDELRAWESRVIGRDEWADRFERELKGIRSSFDVPTVPIAEWKSLSEQVASLTSQQSESIRQRAAWESRVADCETRLANGGGQIDAVEREVQSLRAESQEHAGRNADWSALAGQVASLVSQQAESESERSDVRGRVDHCESQLAERLQQLGDVERQLEDLRVKHQEQSNQAAGWTALSEQVSMLLSQQSEWHNEQHAVRGRVDDCEARLAERLGQLGEFERQLAEVQTTCKEHATQATGWSALSKQVVALQEKQSEWEQRRSAWQGRIEQCETRLGDLGRQLANFEHIAAALQTTSESPFVSAEWTALTEQVVALQNQQAEWEHGRSAWQDHIAQCDTRLADLGRQLADFAQEVAALQTTDESPFASAEWTALAEQVVALQHQQAEWEQRRGNWQNRVEACEAQFGELRCKTAENEQIMAALQTAVQAAVQTATSEPPVAVAEWTTLTEQVAALRSEQAELVQQRADWNARVSAWEGQLAAAAQQSGALASEVEGLRSAHRDQGTQVTELSSLFEQLTALQRQQVEFDQLRTQWQDRVSQWETQLQQRLGQFEAFEQGLQGLYAAQRDQATVVAQLASQVPVGRQFDEPVHPSAGDGDSSGPGSLAPAIAGEAWEGNDVVGPPTAPSSAGEVEPQDERATTAAVVDAEPVATAAPAPVSYLEKYAHIFEDDSAEQPADLPPPHESPHVNRNEADRPEPAAEEHHASHGDEESVEQYMAKLMKRIRGESQGEYGTAASAIVEADVHNTPVSTAYAGEVTEPATELEHDRSSTVAIVDESTSVPLLNDLEEMKPKTPAPAFAADMRALRALANQSARHAIGVHTARRLRRTALTRCVIAVLAICVGLYLLVYSPSWWSLQFVAACVAMFAALYWTKLSFGSLIKAIRVGAFQHFDDVDGDDPLHPPLPIDVDRPSVDSEQTHR
jgi:chromosome segregation ATPase